MNPPKSIWLSKQVDLGGIFFTQLKPENLSPEMEIAFNQNYTEYVVKNAEKSTENL